MIGRLLERVAPRVQAADAWAATDCTVSVTLGTEPPQVWGHEGVTVHLRVRVAGRVGMALRWDDATDALIEAAMSSARAGPEAMLYLPAPQPLHPVATAWPAAAAMDATELVAVARGLRDRLQRAGRTVETWAERTAGRIAVGNTAGVLASYDTTLVGLGLRVRAETTGGPLTLRLQHAACPPPTDQEIARLAETVERRLAPPTVPASAVIGEGWRGPVLFGARAVRALLEPLRQRLHADHLFRGTGPWHRRLGEPVAAAALTLVDDPLASGRPGSRPLDDEGIMCRRRVLIERGRLRGWLADLLTAERVGVPATGHAWRVAMAAPQAGWSNLVMQPGEAHADHLRRAAGILIEDLAVPAADLTDGRLAVATPWAYRLEHGEVTGRLDRVVVHAHADELWHRVGAVGAESEWWGAACLPPVLTEGVLVTA